MSHTTIKAGLAWLAFNVEIIGTRLWATSPASGSIPNNGNRTPPEQFDQIDREIKGYIEFDRAEKDRFNRESYLWTAEDRIEWQEMQTDNRQRLRELREERDAIRKRGRCVP